jgi:hypothetical protein
VGGHLLLTNFGSFYIILINACDYNLCHGNAVKGFGPCGIIFMIMCVYYFGYPCLS